MNSQFSEDFYFRWSSPSELIRFNDGHRDVLGKRAMSGSGQKFRDGYVAGRFAEFRNAKKVRLLKPRLGRATPDFALLFDDAEQRFEVTEADRPGRRRTEEYKQEFLPNGARLLSDDEWTSASDYKDVIEKIVEKKSAKRYDECHGLIVWSNAFGICDEELITSRWWSEACSLGWTNFSEIWVHHRDAFERVCRV